MGLYIGVLVSKPFFFYFWFGLSLLFVCFFNPDRSRASLYSSGQQGNPKTSLLLSIYPVFFIDLFCYLVSTVFFSQA